MTIVTIQIQQKMCKFTTELLLETTDKINQDKKENFLNVLKK